MLRQAERELFSENKHHHHCEHERVQQEQYEELEIFQSDTVADPRTVMVHAHHTAATLATVVCAGWFYALADGALLQELCFHQFKFVPS